jgi:hypothetical protein
MSDTPEVSPLHSILDRSVYLSVFGLTSQTSHFRTPAVYFIPLKSETKCHTHTKQFQNKTQGLIFKVTILLVFVKSQNTGKHAKKQLKNLHVGLF